MFRGTRDREVRQKTKKSPKYPQRAKKKTKERKKKNRKEDDKCEKNRQEGIVLFSESGGQTAGIIKEVEVKLDTEYNFMLRELFYEDGDLQVNEDLTTGCWPPREKEGSHDQYPKTLIIRKKREISLERTSYN